MNHPLCTAEALAILDHRGRSCLHCIAGARDSSASDLDDQVIKGDALLFSSSKKEEEKALNSYFVVVDAILAKCSSLISKVDLEGNTPLHYAAQMNNRLVLRAMLSSASCDDDVLAMENSLGLTARKVC